MISASIPDVLRRNLAEAFAGQGCCRLPRLAYSAVAFMAWAMRRQFGRTLVLVTDSQRAQDELRGNLQVLAGARRSDLLSLPAQEAPRPAGHDFPATIAGARLDALVGLLEARAPLVLLTTVQALRQAVPPPAKLRAALLRLALQDQYEPQDLLSSLEQQGYALASEVQFPGQAAQRGGLLDVWPLGAAAPARIEFLGSAIESIRSFDPADQRSLGRLSRLLIPPADEARLIPAAPASFNLLMDYLPPETIYFWTNLTSLAPPDSADAGAGAAKARQPAAASWETFRQALLAQAGVWECVCGWEAGLADCEPWRSAPLINPGFEPLAEIIAPPRGLFEPDVLAARRRIWLAGLAERARQGISVYLFFNTPGALARFRESYPRWPFHLRLGALSDGFINPALRLALVAEAQLSGLRKATPGDYAAGPAPRRRRRRASLATLSDWLNLEPGELVVHADHGLGKYLGLYEIAIKGKLQETLAIEYANKAKLYVPVAQAHLLSRYVGAGKVAVALHRLGGKRWLREKTAAAQAVQNLARSMLATQARREAQAGFAYPADVPWQHEFENAFAYQETPDQQQAIEEIKADMEGTRPMDRLICGDVGYGKTEAALRAAFKAVMAGKQVALLVPTTVLAQQHFEVFLERLSAYPIRVDLLCRFRTKAQQADTLKALRSGAVDIVIGTHRLLQADVAFKDLGLVIIDEEQRFGVAHKERLKDIKQLVDVLTLTATPIPRTLYLSLTGARDISMIQTPPRARLPIETLVVKNDDHTVQTAIQRELARGGQVYYLHNRVMTIGKVYERLRRLLPQARLGLAHGQMPAAALAEVMRSFAQGSLDVLLCTSIIESGVDIPNVNSILIDRADRFGMADLYQLRGRVGRSTLQAYAYLLLPVHGHLLDTPRRRINAIMEHRELGAGFRLALRDLEIRGAGNLLGAEQSGHIAAIGFDLYCQLLRRSIAQLKRPAGAAERAVPWLVNVDVELDFIDLSSQAADISAAAFLPSSYLEDERLRVNLYRKIAAIQSAREMEALREELRDRFGPIPGPLDRLLKIALLRLLAAAKRISLIESRAGKIMLKRAGAYLMCQHRFPRLRSTGASERLDEIRRSLEQLDGAACCESSRRRKP